MPSLLFNGKKRKILTDLFSTHHNTTPEIYEKIRSDNALITHRLELIQKKIDKWKPRTVLDFGCGTGGILFSLAQKFPSLTFIGYDPFEKFIHHAELFFRRENLSYTANIETIGEFNMVYSIDVLHHVDNLEDIIFRISERFSKIDNRYWLVIEPNSYNPYINLLQHRPGEAPFKVANFCLKAKESGLQIKKYYYYHLWPSAVKRIGKVGGFLERWLEFIPFFGGSIIIEIEKT